MHRPSVTFGNLRLFAARLALVLYFVAVQTAGILHLTEHAVEGGSDHCEMCDGASHLMHADVPDLPPFLLPPVPRPNYVPQAQYAFAGSAPVHYTPRAPPL